jgi:flavodoxin
MNKNILALSILISLVFITVFACNNSKVKAVETKPKVLVVYFSHSGNTKIVANKIKNFTDADILEIIPERAYPQDYDSVVNQAKIEIKSNFRPKLKNDKINIQNYDIIFVGSPNWWNTIAPPISTFLTSYDLSGKKIVTFITHEGSRLGVAESDIKKICPNSTILKGLAIRGSKVNDSDNDIINCLKVNNINVKK